MKNRVIIITIISILILSSIASISSSFAAKEVQVSPAPSNQHPEPETVIVPENNNDNPILEKSINQVIPADQGKIYIGSKKYKGHFKEDHFFKLTKNDLERMLEEGFTIQEIYTADDMANEIMINPEEILKVKKEEKISWDKVKVYFNDKRKAKAIEKMQESKIYSDIKRLGLDSNEELKIYLNYLANDEMDINQIIQFYKESKLQKKELHVVIDNSKVKNKSTELKSDIPKEVKEKLQKFANENQIPVEKLIENYKKELEIQKDVKEEKQFDEN